jgi:hypothetical protein
MTDRELMHKALEALTNLTRNAELQGDKFPEGNGWHALADAGENAITALRDRLAQPSTDLDEMTARKDAAYAERNKVVAGFAALAMKLGYAACRTRTAIEGWSDDWHGCVYIQLPTGQVSWHYHDSEAELFSFLPENAVTWDGHDTDEKYRRVLALRYPTTSDPRVMGEPSAEPVAYRYRYIDGWRTNGGGPVNGVHPVECQPLYTSPPPRTPLTDEEINDEMDRLLLSPVEQEAFGSGVRYAERKHGIGEKQ